MINLLHLWVVHYKLPNGKKNVCNFVTFENNGVKYYKIRNLYLGIDKEFTKDEGNEYYLELFQIDKEAIVNKIC